MTGAFFDTYNELAGFPEFVLPSDGHSRFENGDWRWRRKTAASLVPGHQIVKFRAGLIVQSCVIVEVKGRPEIDLFNKAQVLHYLKATDLEVGLLVNFGRRPEFERVVCERSRKERPAL